MGDTRTGRAARPPRSAARTIAAAGLVLDRSTGLPLRALLAAALELERAERDHRTCEHMLGGPGGMRGTLARNAGLAAGAAWTARERFGEAVADVVTGAGPAALERYQALGLANEAMLAARRAARAGVRSV